jgi:hypothetical protein
MRFQNYSSFFLAPLFSVTTSANPISSSVITDNSLQNIEWQQGKGAYEPGNCLLVQVHEALLLKVSQLLKIYQQLHPIMPATGKVLAVYMTTDPKTEFPVPQLQVNFGTTPSIVARVYSYDRRRAEAL